MADRDLIFFNKEGDCLNFKWNVDDEKWEGSLIFDENSNDTFKTNGLYVFESIPSFEYENPGNLALNKFQLFNEYKFNITGNNYFSQSVTNISLPNNDNTFYSKWVYGDHFEVKYPIGSQIYFNSPAFEFTNINQSYTVVFTKKNAVLIISNLDNYTFNQNYGNLLGLTSSYENLTVSGLNSIGIYNYVNSDLSNNLSTWSEPDFYLKYYNKRKITILNTYKNNGVFTVNNIDIFDKTYYKYKADVTSFTQSNDITIKVIAKTDLPLVYTGDLTLSDNIIRFANNVPKILKPGVQFSIPASILNSNFMVIDYIPDFIGNVNLKEYATSSQVMWNNNIYQCVQSYTWSGTSSITPDNTSYWSPPTYLPIIDVLNAESLYNVEIHLTTNVIQYTYPFTQSAEITLASAALKYSEDIKFYNIDLYFDGYSLHADLMYPSLYTYVNIYNGTVSVGNTIKIYEQNVGIEETLTPEINNNVSVNYAYNIVFDDLDSYGIVIYINGQEYQQDIEWVYVSNLVDMERTIDKTLRNWLVKWYASLSSVGIVPNLHYIGTYTSFYYNSIILQTQYPNVPLKFKVNVGTTANFNIEHSEIIFNDLGTYLSIKINGIIYGLSTVINSGTIDIPATLSSWIDIYGEILSEYGIYVSNILNMLIFKIKKQDQVLTYTISTGKTTLPGIYQYKIINKIKGTFGALIASNEVLLPDTGTYSFEDNPFATGQVMAINNTIYPYDNGEYNIIHLTPQSLILSYQGPFWGTNDNPCDVSPFTTIAFNGGFGATGCLPIIPPPITTGGNFNLNEFSAAFSLNYASTNTYTVKNYEISNNNLVDIIYLQFVASIYVLGNNISIMDSASNTKIGTILPTFASTSISLTFNPINNYLYWLTQNYLYVVDPTINVIIKTIILSDTGNVCMVNITNGDVYISYSENTIIDIWDKSNIYKIQISFTGIVLNMIYNTHEKDVYVAIDNDTLYRINGTTRVLRSFYNISGLTSNIFYEAINSSVYVFGDTNLLYVDNEGVLNTVTNIYTADFNDILFNNIIGNIAISQTNILSQIDLLGGFISNMLIPGYGSMIINQYDGDIYIASKNINQVVVVNATNNTIKNNISLSGTLDKVIYNPDRKSIIGISESENIVIEIGVILNSGIVLNTSTYSILNSTNYGTLDSNYVNHIDVWLKTRQYLRKPRENYTGQATVSYIWKWDSDQIPELFLYDFSGSQLDTTGAYAYTGPKPLELIALNKNKNKNIKYNSLPEYQQTIFSEVKYGLDYIDSTLDISPTPEPMEVFIGFKSDNEGYIKSTLKLYKREEISFSIVNTSINNNTIQFKYIKDVVNGDYGMIILNMHSVDIFTSDIYGVSRGLKPGQHIELIIVDNTNSKNKYISVNNGVKLKIKNVFNRYIVVDFIDLIRDEFTQIDDYPIANKTTYLSVNFTVIDKEIGSFVLSGQTEIEDIRYAAELSNIGHNIVNDEIFIFKTYDINEQGVDWGFMNRKRKEMLMVRHDIFPYIGSYKAIINSINFFGYNDLELYEYYRNVNVNSPDFAKLVKVQISDIFNNSVEGWVVNDSLQVTMPNVNYEYTNLFNLTYNITDINGNNILIYSLPEIIIKLQGLKKWLQKNVIPISHRILDITGRTAFVSDTYITHKHCSAKILNINQSLTPIDFKLTEAYLMPVNTGSTVYTCNIDFFAASTSHLPDYFSIKIRTYKTYKEWNPFTYYNINECVIYYGIIYQSIIANNRLNDPRKYNNINKWNYNTDYKLGEEVNYNNSIYEYIGTQSSYIIYGTQSNITPAADIQHNQSYSKWVDITVWKQIDYIPVQTFNEYRTGTQSYLFTLDSNIDPFIVIEVTSDNGYGQNYTRKKTYEIRGINDLYNNTTVGDKILPFEPIVEITTPLF